MDLYVTQCVERCNFVSVFKVCLKKGADTEFCLWLDLEPFNDVLPTQNCHYLNFNTIVSIVNTV